MSFIPGRLVLSNHAYCKNNLLTVRRHYFSKDLAFLCTNLLIKTHDGWFGVSGHRFAASLCFVRQQWSHSVRKRKQGIKGLHLPGEQAPAPHSSIRFLPPPCSDTVNIESTASKKKKTLCSCRCHRNKAVSRALPPTQGIWASKNDILRP